MKDGVHKKFKVERTDGSSRKGGKHEHCAYFVLDLEHDEYALAALSAYAEACRATHPELVLAMAGPACNCREAACPHRNIFGPNTPSEMMGDLLSRSR